MNIAEIKKAASAAYVRGYGQTLMEFAERHERAIAAAVAAVAPLLLAEPTEDERRQMATDFAAVANVEGSSGWDNFYHALRNMNANRLASLTAKPDPAVEAVKALLKGTMSTAACDRAFCDETAPKIVAAVDAARAK